MARLARIPNTSSLSINSPMRRRAFPSSPPATLQTSLIPGNSQSPPFHPRARPLSKLSVSIFRLLRNHPGFHQEDESWRTRLGLYKLVQQIVESVVEAVEEEPMMFSKKERRKKEDGQQVAVELGLTELMFADKVSFQSPVESAVDEYFRSGKSPTKPSPPSPKNGKGKSAALTELNPNSLAIRKIQPVIGRLRMGTLDSEIGDGLSKDVSIKSSPSKTSTTGRAARLVNMKSVQAELLKDAGTISEVVSQGSEQIEGQPQHIAPERVTRGRRGIISKGTPVCVEARVPTGKSTRGTRANTKADLPAEGNLAAKAMGIKRVIPLKRSMQGFPEVISPLSQRTTAPPPMKSKKLTLGEVVNESVVTTESRSLRSTNRLAGTQGGIGKARGSLRCINKELQISSEAMAGAGEDMNFNFRRLSGEACVDSNSPKGKFPGKSAQQGTHKAVAALEFSVITDKVPGKSGNISSKGKKVHNLDLTGLARLEPTIVRRSSRSTKGLQIQDPSKERK